MADLPAFTGGCQCGAVRYSVTAGSGKVNVCFCNMCKRATGSPVPSFISVPRTHVTWQGTPSVYASSDVATRGFCSDCGTPLYYAGNESTTWGLTAGSADVALPPNVVFYYDQHPEWLGKIGELPKLDFDITVCSGDDRSS